MKITIEIDRGKHQPNTKEAKEAKRIFQSLIATEFPVGILFTKPSDEPQKLSFSGTITDFVKAVVIKKQYLASEQTSQDRKEMVEKLKPIYEKAKE